ncbi:linoleate diol synthase [Armillaria novae-zelandiae]|uniref:Linoleate diol synthase n=1 Tax=Armillaria novae-zelandiae TaxID=153914 RepID=A0AA39PR48_9AGAR|nr:linoleate diol synthase [Armillaria novae-zelandiae]
MTTPTSAPPRKTSIFRRSRQISSQDVESNGTDAAATNGAQPSVKSDEPASHGTGLPKALTDLLDQIKKGLPGPLDPTTITALLDAVHNTDSLDDRKLLLEHALVFLSRLPPGSLADTLQNKVVSLLYNDLAHPPATYLGNDYKFRKADGSNNNVLTPDMGKAGTPYARSVQQIHPLPRRNMPDSGLIFDTLLKRDGFVKHPGGLSSLMFAFAALVIHTVFRTSHTDISINETSSYVDLAPLYGHNQETQDKVRNRDGYGKLHKDVFAEDRLMLLPPAVCVLLVLFSRNHNYIAQKLYEVNEHGTFVDPSTLSKEDAGKQDEELFQTARLVNCGWFGGVVFSDYFSCILGLIREGSSWSLNPNSESMTMRHSSVEKEMSAASNLTVFTDWHATTSAKDEQWVERLMGDMFEGKPFDEVTVTDFKAVGKKLSAMDPDLTHWTFGNMTRQTDGSFKDEDLAKVLQDATDEPAAAFRARGTPPSMRLHEILGIEQNRRWGVCSLNEFRKFLGLKTYATFLEWNSDPEIAKTAEKLYGNINNLELYVGLQAEEAKPLVDGAGLCPGYTISRAILSDAIALTRGDRFFTRDFTPANLTSWGFADCQRDPNAFGFGSTLGKLFLRTLPQEFGENGNSVYAFFPLMTPESMKVHLTKMGVVDKYDLARPVKKAPGTVAFASTGGSPKYVDRATKILDAKGKGFYIAQDNEKRREAVVRALTEAMGAEDKIAQYFYTQTLSLMSEQSLHLVGSETRVVDVVRDVFKPLTVGWVATEVAGIQLTKGSQHGAYSPAELYDILGDIYEYIFLSVEESKLVNFQQKVQKDVKHLSSHLKSVDKFSIVNLVESAFSSNKSQKKDEKFIKRLAELGIQKDEVNNTVLSILVGASVELSLAMTNMLNICLDNVKSATSEARVREVMRLEPTFHGPSANSSPTVEGQVQEEIFSVSKCIGEPLTVKILSETLRAVLGHPGLSRGPGDCGKLNRFKIDDKHIRYGYLDSDLQVSPWPTSLVVRVRIHSIPDYFQHHNASSINTIQPSDSACYDLPIMSLAYAFSAAPS